MKITTQYWQYECGDGCCFNWGVDLWIDDKKVGNRTFSDTGQALEYVLTVLLGHEVEYLDDNYGE